MSDDTEGSGLNEPLDITFDSAVLFFENVCKDATCPACGEKKWEIPTQAGNDELCLLVRSNILLDGQRIFDLVIECRTCGFIRTHRSGKITEWLDSQSEASDQE